MGTKDIQQNFRSLAEASLSPDTEKLSDQRRDARWSSPEVLSAQRVELDRARGEYLRGHYYRAEEMVQRLLTGLEPVISRCEEREPLARSAHRTLCIGEDLARANPRRVGATR